MSLLNLPNELLRQIIGDLRLPKDLSCLARVNRDFYDIFLPWLYDSEIDRDGCHKVLVFATQMGHISTVRLLLRLNADRSIQGKSQLNPNGLMKGDYFRYRGLGLLAWSSIRGDVDMIRLLLEIESIPVDIKCPKGRTPLSFAAEQGHLDIVRLLLGAGADPNTQDDIKRTPLHWAGSPEPMKGPRNIPGNTEILSLDPRFPFHCPVMAYFEEDIVGSISWDDAQNIKRYCTQCPEAKDLDQSASLASISLSWSCGEHYEEVLKLLLQHGANVNLLDEKLRTPFCWAAACGYLPLMELLLDHGASLHSPESYRSPISWAAENGRISAVQFLIDRGVSIESHGESCISPLSYAAMKGHYDLVELLVENTVRREREDFSSDWSPLTWAAVAGHEEVVELLLSSHLRKWPDLPLGSTALCWAACRGHTAIIEILLSAGAEMAPFPKIYDSLTPLQLATRSKHEDTIKYLLRTGKAEINAMDSHGWTALTWTSWASYDTQNNEKDTRIKQHLLDHGAASSYEACQVRNRHLPHLFYQRQLPTQSNRNGRWPISFRVDWTSLARGERFRCISYFVPGLTPATMRLFEGWSYNRPVSE
ncbi:ankyrin [Penicillium cataractarum]|uniref:Ankyrin n=1 Tax=Penicillium cataractarum TaxID=2100454 RepID=A0A9W9R7Q9_9EURO|nr:ankyrin [Penicillium cataractarum]KAJ5355177.1 ankyrin [Penicillium cataractarum]